MKKALIRTSTALLAALLVLNAFSGGVAAQTSDGEVGICVIGVDSPCNGEQWDGDSPSGDLPSDVPSEVPGEVPSGDLPSDISDGIELPA